MNDKTRSPLERLSEWVGLDENAMYDGTGRVDVVVDRPMIEALIAEVVVWRVAATHEDDFWTDRIRATDAAIEGALDE